MADRDEIVEWSNDYLRLHDFHDYGPMGLQFSGNREVNKIATAVSVCHDVIVQAGEWGADMLLTHHGLWWNNESRLLDIRTSNRIALAKKYEISILGYHLCLDAHPVIGNNALLARRLHLTNLRRFGEIGWGGDLPFERDAWSWTMLTFERRCTSFLHGPNSINSVAVIAGGAPQYLTQAYKEGYDAYVTGEAAEFTTYQAKELGMHFIAAGRHSTERSGIKALGAELSERFNVEHEFFDMENPV